MARWVALLRGVNVNGITIRSGDLAELVAGLGYERVRTVLASGNVVLDGPDDEPAAQVKARLEAALGERFGYDAWIVLVPAQALAAVVEGFPFPPDDEDRTPYVVFSSDPAVVAALAARARELASHEDDRLELAGDVLYWQPPRGRSTDTPFARLSSAARYKPAITTRTLRTVDKLVATAED